MAWAEHPFKLILLFSLAAFLFNGCAAGPSRPSSQVSSQAPMQKSAALTSEQKAANAIEAKDYEQAIKQYEKINKNDEAMQDEYLYGYGLSLSRAGRYEEAIAQLTTYIDTLGRRGSNFLAALDERIIAEEKLRRQREETAKAQQTAANLSQIGLAIDDNWHLVQKQLVARPASLTEPFTGMEMILIEGGCYQMGDLFGDGRENERPPREVCVEDFYLGKYEVTQGQWNRVMGYNPAAFRDKGDHYPVEQVSWEEATHFASLLSGSLGSYRLPSEAEWEYAARSRGQQQKFSGSDAVAAVAWYEDNSGGSSQPVGQKQPNDLGLHDMSGNVYEWCGDKVVITISEPQDETKALTSEERIRRGGGWDSRAAYQRVSFRRNSHPSEYRADDVGFRLTLPAPAP